MNWTGVCSPGSSGSMRTGSRATRSRLGAAIVSCCDALNAMTTDRSYRDAMPLDEAIEELEANSGTQFSPAVVEALLQVLREDPLTAGARGPRAVAAT